jgi:hypothetical protein
LGNDEGKFMPEKKPDNWQIVSVRLPHELFQRLDRYLDWRKRHRRVKSLRNAALREALGSWLDDQEQRAGFLFIQRLTLLLFLPSEDSQLTKAPSVSWSGNN